MFIRIKRLQINPMTHSYFYYCKTKLFAQQNSWLTSQLMLETNINFKA